MVKALALQTIHVCKEPGRRRSRDAEGKKAVVEEITPGRVFDVSDAEVKAYENAGAARRATKAEIAAAGVGGQIPLDDEGPVEVNVAAARR